MIQQKIIRLVDIRFSHTTWIPPFRDKKTSDHEAIQSKPLKGRLQDQVQLNTIVLYAAVSKHFESPETLLSLTIHEIQQVLLKTINVYLNIHFNTENTLCFPQLGIYIMSHICKTFDTFV
ncbi:hypothetical protein B9Z33_08535 [Limnohabitans sp. T6-20]|nr:hypothetical protein B9Z33_08535 [Limnohabitans sp. T6-20]